MAYWVEFTKMKGIRERAGDDLVSARRYAAHILSGGRMGNYADIYTSKLTQIPCGWVGYLTNELSWNPAPRLGPSYTYKMYKNGKIIKGSARII